MKNLVRKLVSIFSKKPKYYHHWLEVGLTDECEHGCKVLRCSCGEMMISHRKIYGCTMNSHADYRYPRTLSRNGCRTMDVREI